MNTDYDKQATEFLSRHGLKLRITLSDSKPAPWEDDKGYRPHYRVTLSGAGRRMTFDFWGSLNDGAAGTHPSEYSVLACISSDLGCPESFDDFCAEYGYEEDSRKALQTFRRADRFARRLRDFLTSEEQDNLAEIH